MNVKNQIHVYRTYVRPVLTYNINVWKGVALTTFKKLQAFQNIVLRSCLRLRPHSTTFPQVNNVAVHVMSTSRHWKSLVMKSLCFTTAIMSTDWYERCNSVKGVGEKKIGFKRPMSLWKWKVKSKEKWKGKKRGQWAFGKEGKEERKRKRKKSMNPSPAPFITTDHCSVLSDATVWFIICNNSPV